MLRLALALTAVVLLGAAIFLGWPFDAEPKTPLGAAQPVRAQPTSPTSTDVELAPVDIDVVSAQPLVEPNRNVAQLSSGLTVPADVTAAEAKRIIERLLSAAGTSAARVAGEVNGSEWMSADLAALAIAVRASGIDTASVVNLIAAVSADANLAGATAAFLLWSEGWDQDSEQRLYESLERRTVGLQRSAYLALAVRSSSEGLRAEADRIAQLFVSADSDSQLGFKYSVDILLARCASIDRALGRETALAMIDSGLGNSMNHGAWSQLVMSSADGPGLAMTAAQDSGHARKALHWIQGPEWTAQLSELAESESTATYDHWMAASAVLGLLSIGTEASLDAAGRALSSARDSMRDRIRSELLANLRPSTLADSLLVAERMDSESARNDYLESMLDRIEERSPCLSWLPGFESERERFQAAARSLSQSLPGPDLEKFRERLAVLASD